MIKFDKKQIYSMVGTALGIGGIIVNLIAGNMKGKAAEIDMKEQIAKEVANQLGKKGS